MLALLATFDAFICRDRFLPWGVDQRGILGGASSTNDRMVSSEYILRMTELLERALEAMRTLSPVQQDEIAAAVLRLVGGDETISPLSAEESAAIARSKAAAARGEFATEAQVRAVWAKHGL